MRYQKKQLLRKLDTLNEVNKKFRNGAGNNGLPGLDELTMCQSEAIEVGNCIESLGEIAEPVVHILEAYCESLYQLSMNLDNREACRKISKGIQKQLVQVGNSIRYDLPEGKKEILFLPYKASMWDSLESVWMAAREDELCKAIVMPIPYFEKNPDKSLGQMHDEKDLYPDYVPIVDWREYDIADRRPDVIYINNPYDRLNFVTSVHPSFYAKELKKYTDMLVYIPYFVAVNNQIDERFCVLPGTMYSDRVIVESEEVREIYLKTFHKFEEENHCQGLYGNLEEKFVALGSPKIDRVRRFMQEEIAVPQAWTPMVYKADGSRKKIILYNTTISAFMNNTEYAIRKLEHTLLVFKNNPEMALLWRPHPLLLPTVRNFNTELYQKLCRVMETYREERWGIYDDTADVEKAIALSDAYYGDWSSVVTLYQATGKPIMIQDYKEVG